MSPRRGAGEGHIKRITLRSGRRAWRGWITVGYRPNGTPIRRSVQRPTRQAVQDDLARLRERYSAGLDLDAEATARLHALLDRWLAHFIEHEAPKKRTPRTYAWAIGHIKATTPNNPLVRACNAVALQHIMDALPAHLSASSLRLCRVALQGAFRQAHLWKLRPDNPAEKLDIPKREREEAERRIVGTEEAARLLRALVDERLGLGAALTYAVAARPGEIAALRRQDVDLDAGTLTICASHNRVGKEIERETPKSKRGVRTLRIPDELRAWVARHLSRVATERAMMGAAWTAPDEGYLFVRETDGAPLAGGALYDVATRVAQAIGLGNVGPRILRRSMLSALGAAGVDAKVRAAIGGHTEAVTERHYREVAQAEIDAAMGRMRFEEVQPGVTPPATPPEPERSLAASERDGAE